MIGLEKEKALQEKMAQLGVRSEDIQEKFIRAQGPGGQNVNKVATCVHLRHLPTGIEVKCQEERSQSQNRYLARQILLKKIESQILGKLSAENKRIEKIRRQKRRRSRRAKAKMLEAKRMHSAKKSLRASVRQVDIF
ncbi:MAG: peptide chain release factor-like protein [Candidatus Omnitrophota bacterium]